MQLHKVSSLNASQVEQIKKLVHACTAADGTRLSFPFDDADLFLFFEHDGRIVSAIAFIPMDDLLYECSAFTDPEFRGQGLFSELLDEGIEELPEDSELMFYTDQKNTAAAAVLESIGAELDSKEHMMELLPENFSIAACLITARRPDQTESAAASLESDPEIDIHAETLNIDGTETLRFQSAHAVINFSVFPSHYYLYGFEVEKSCRGMGYGTKFLHAVLARLLRGNAARPVLLQVSGSNAPALTLYKKTGFQITETLCCYLY